MEMTKIQETDDDAYEMLVGVIRRWLGDEIPDPSKLGGPKRSPNADGFGD